MGISLSKMWSAYLTLLASYPVPTKSITAGIITGLSDVTAQYIASPNQSFTISTVIRQGLIALLYRAPMVHFWYVLLELLMKGWDPSAPLTVVLKVLLDQIAFTPVLLSGYLFILSVLRKQSFKEFLGNYVYKTGNFWQILFANWKLWPIVHLINFRYVPIHLRVLFGNVVGFFWSIYVILQSSKPSASVGEKEGKKD
eukprot:TRINITY_DN1807_c0_g1_i1.p1 TRINITY_DN1807_c0_g1~~TRINITY_DN1807_c0_g1_i1.p1  ORF type:complete len:198 (-),score=51.03 TRINITY_DN1807_c0_g1_i1:588-1181(-)